MIHLLKFNSNSKGFFKEMVLMKYKEKSLSKAINVTRYQENGTKMLKQLMSEIEARSLYGLVLMSTIKIITTLMITQCY